jgi:hypothetical protein
VGGGGHDALLAGTGLGSDLPGGVGLGGQATRSVLRDPLTPKTGIGFVIDVDRVFGME